MLKLLLMMAEAPYRTKNGDTQTKKRFLTFREPDREHFFIVENSSVEVVLPVK